MLKFKEFKYSTFKNDSGVEDTSYQLGRDIFIEYKDKTKKDLPKLIFEMLTDAYKGNVLTVLRHRNILFEADYFIYNGEFEEQKCIKFLSTPTTYKEVFNVQT